MSDGKNLKIKSIPSDQLGGTPSLTSNGYWQSFPRDKVQPGHDANHSPPSSAEVKNEELYILFPLAPAWRVMGQLSFTLTVTLSSFLTGILSYTMKCGEIS
jgi:hypothetical protein